MKKALFNAFSIFTKVNVIKSRKPRIIRSITISKFDGLYNGIKVVLKAINPMRKAPETESKVDTR